MLASVADDSHKIQTQRQHLLRNLYFLQNGGSASHCDSSTLAACVYHMCVVLFVPHAANMHFAHAAPDLTILCLCTLILCLGV